MVPLRQPRVFKHEVAHPLALVSSLCIAWIAVTSIVYWLSVRQSARARLCLLVFSGLAGLAGYALSKMLLEHRGVSAIVCAIVYTVVAEVIVLVLTARSRARGA